MTQKIKRIRLNIDLDANELPVAVFRANYRQEDDANPGTKTNGQGKGDLGPAATSLNPTSADTIDWAGLSAEASPTAMIAALVAAAKADAGV